MKITRTINGEDVDIELTAEELSTAYYEQEHNFDVQDVQSRFNGEITDSELEDNYELTPEQITDKVIENIAYEARRNIHPQLSLRLEVGVFCRMFDKLGGRLI